MTYDKEQRAEKMVRVKVDCAVPNLIVGGGEHHRGKANAQLLAEGENEIVVYESDLPSIQALVETLPAEVERAKQWVEKNIKYNYEKIVEGKTGALSEKEQQKFLTEARMKTGSWQKRFLAENFRNVLPLRSCEVVETGILPPQSFEAAQQQLHQEWIAEQKLRLSSEGKEDKRTRR